MPNSSFSLTKIVFKDLLHFQKHIFQIFISDAHSKSLHSRLGLEAMDHLVEIVGQYAYCTTKYFAYFINY